MTIEEAFYPAEAVYAKQQLQDTWGHLAPKKGKSYKGYIVFSQACDGFFCLIDYDFEGLPGSPWLYDALQAFIEEYAVESGVVYRFDGYFRNYGFFGSVKKVA